MQPEHYLLQQLATIPPKSMGASADWVAGLYDRVADAVRNVPGLTHTRASAIPPTDLAQGMFVPGHISHDLSSFSGTADKYTTSFANNTIPMAFFVYGPNTAGVSEELQAILPVIEWMCADRSRPPLRAPTTPLTVHLYMGAAKKQFPVSPETTITYTHCNAAVTRACNPSGEILVYRREEWGKTLVHELFHSLCLDMMGNDGGVNAETTLNNELGRLFHLPGEPRFRETYCEWWATVLYCAAMATRPRSGMTFEHAFQAYVEIERHHAFLQLGKLLRFWCIEWYDVLKQPVCRDVHRAKRTIPKEGTNVFCYFVLRCVLFHDMNAVAGLMGTGLKRVFDTPTMATHIRHTAYGVDFDRATRDCTLRRIVSQVRSSHMSDTGKASTVAHLMGNFRMTATSGWML
jgi:hypothetical protein